MTDKRRTGVPFEAADDDERAIWEAMAEMPGGEPSRRLRQSFYSRLEDAARPPWWRRLGTGLGISGRAGWLTAAGSAAVGLIAGLLLAAPGVGSDAERLAALEDSVRALNKTLILDRITNPSPGKRLAGVMDAMNADASDPDIANALLDLATQERVYAVRSAAIDALGPRLARSAVAGEIMAMLDAADSPHVQLALIDLVFRHGTAEQVGKLIELARTGGLHPALAAHVLDTAGREIT